MAFNALDTRQYRSDQACGDGTHTGCEEALAENRTMLGAEQEAWLDQRLSQGDAAWNVLAQQVPIFARDFSARDDGQQESMDKWTGYHPARSRLLNSIDEKRLTNVVFLSGDVHSHWGADVPLDLAEPDGRSVAVEFTNASSRRTATVRTCRATGRRSSRTILTWPITATAAATSSAR